MNQDEIVICTMAHPGMPNCSHIHHHIYRGTYSRVPIYHSDPYCRHLRPPIDARELAQLWVNYAQYADLPFDVYIKKLFDL